MTEPEKRLWWHLRHRLPANGPHFRRQVSIGSYIVDFCCLKERLVIEVDGNQHGFDDQLRRDATRTDAIEAHGFHVLRFTNREVMTSIDVALDTTLAAFGTAPPIPDPSPRGGGEILT
jgi:very-short-patch-repair endonuclease